ncbi:hypothetical protein BX600DRAFT_432768 [Xylariales sp. PMI_506]|nr:hypothetical protein BX600DRAFT_432768 [Xylariales sp. PMI_506]
MPPTPTSSTEIKGQDAAKQLSTLQMSFELPPSAIGAHDVSRASAPEIKNSSPITGNQVTSPKAPYPLQASEAVKSRRRLSTIQKESFTLPPPPTRSRKIIQVKPRPQEEPDHPTTPVKPAPAASKSAPAPGGSKKKPPSANSAAGRKIARKTAHSLIERRRRSKMNEEFAVLKGLIPACTGEMHKLAILQASIEYVRYLEDCVAQLKSQHDRQLSIPTPAEFVLRKDAYEEDEAGDIEMTSSEAASPTFTEPTPRSQRPSESPVLLAEDARRRHDSYSSASTDHRHYSYSASSAVSPAFGPQIYGSYNRGPQSTSNSTLTSPALPPQRDLDQEATAALLMLNNDRRAVPNNNNSRNARGMSVRDLLSA